MSTPSSSDPQPKPAIDLEYKKLEKKFEALEKDFQFLQKKYLDLLNQSSPSNCSMDDYQNELVEIRHELVELKVRHPVYHLLSLKKIEIERLKNALSQLDPKLPEWKSLDSVIKDHLLELNEIELIASNTEKNLERLDSRASGALLKTLSPKATPSNLEQVGKNDLNEKDHFDKKAPEF